MRWWTENARGWDITIIVSETRRGMRAAWKRDCVKHRWKKNNAIAICATYKPGVKKVDLYFSRQDLTYEAIAHECHHAVEQIARERKKQKYSSGEEFRAKLHGEMVDYVIETMKQRGLHPRTTGYSL